MFLTFFETKMKIRTTFIAGGIVWKWKTVCVNIFWLPEKRWEIWKYLTGKWHNRLNFWPLKNNSTSWLFDGWRKILQVIKWSRSQLCMSIKFFYQTQFKNSFKIRLNLETTGKIKTKTSNQKLCKSKFNYLSKNKIWSHTARIFMFTNWVIVMMVLTILYERPFVTLLPCT